MATRTAATADRRTGVLRFHDLGLLVVDRDGQSVSLGGGRLVAALTLLLVEADHVVGADALAEAMWGDQAGPRSSSTLDSHIWRLRNVLDPGRARGTPTTVLLREGNGYRLVATTEQVDSMRFAVLADEALGLLTDGQPERALRRTGEALALWRGHPFAALADGPLARPAVARLGALYAQVRERQVEALLALDQPGRALVELVPAIADEPLREHLWALRMLAYHRSGRTDMALAAYREAHGLLRAEIGVEPGAELRALQAKILAEDPSLALPRPAPRSERRAADIHLPTRLSRLIGRDGDRDHLTAQPMAHRLVTIVGAAGCGKTRLAVEVARAAAPEFPDGVWAVDLTSAGGEEEVAATLTSALGLTLPTAGSARDALRSFGRGRRMLLLLDNCEHVLDPVAGIVDDLLVNGSELTVLATGREPLEVDGEVVVPLAPLPLHGGKGRGGAAVELFLERLAAAGRAEPLTDDDLDQVVRICGAVDGVPLAIELAAARARAYSFAEIAAQVTADASALGRIGRGPSGHHRTVRFAVEQSYRTLDREEADVHRALAAIPGPFTTGAAAALVGRPPGRVGELLTRLVHRSLLVPLGPAAPGRPSRFAQLAIVRGHAAHVAGTEAEAAAAARDAFVGKLVARQPRLGTAGEVDWFAAVDDDLAALRATLQHNLDAAPAPLGVQVVARLGLYWYYRGMMVEARRWQELALRPADAPVLDRSVVRLMLGGSLCMANRADLGVPLIEEGWAAARGTAAAGTERFCDVLGVLAGALYTSGHPDLGTVNARQLEAIAAGNADPTTAVVATLGTTLAAADAEPPHVFLARAGAVHAAAAAAGNTFVAWMVSDAAAAAALAAGSVQTGMIWSDRMIAQHHALRVREGPTLLEVRANLLTLDGRARDAVRLYSAARAHNQRAGMRWPLRSVTTGLLQQAADALDRVEFEEAWQEGAHLTLDDLA